MAFAPGKILLFGEHAVVHGQPALAAALSCGVEARVTGRGAGRLSVPAWGIEVVSGGAHKVAHALDALRAALPFDASGYDLELDADLPAGAGVGSSAAMSVAVARALAEAVGVTLDEPTLFDAALAAERVFHGNPSGLDHAIAMRGGLVRFVRGTPPRITPLTVGGPLHFVVAQVAPGADTGRMVAGVAALRAQHPAPIEATLGAIGATVEQAEAALVAGDGPALGRLMNLNHGLLMALGVSTAELDTACHAAREAGALGAKLTGAGGGGCMIALVTPESLGSVQSSLGLVAIRLLEARLGR